jgi:hypothetical protein
VDNHIDLDDDGDGILDALELWLPGLIANGRQWKFILESDIWFSPKVNFKSCAFHTICGPVALCNNVWWIPLTKKFK